MYGLQGGLKEEALNQLFCIEVPALHQPLQLQADGCQDVKLVAHMGLLDPVKCKIDTSEETCKTK